MKDGLKFVSAEHGGQFVLTVNIIITDIIPPIGSKLMLL